MTMGKIATDIEQSQKLAKILPIKTADVYYWYSGIRYYLESMDDGEFVECNDIPAWSLDALINLMPDTIEDKCGTIFGLNIKKNFVEYYNPSMGALYATYNSVNAETLVDACVKMLEKLKEEKRI